jgi:hypothetical protein
MVEEQEQELEALHAIYSDQIEQVSSSSFRMKILPDEEDNYVGVKIDVDFGVNYPNEAPTIQLNPILGLCEISFLMQAIEETIENSMGSPMMFEVIERIR